MGSSPSKPKLQDPSVKRGDTITLAWKADCKVTGVWRKNGEILVSGGDGGKDGSRVSMNQPREHKVFYLTITDAREEDEGEYTLELENRHGMQSGSAYVKLTELDSSWRKPQWEGNEDIKMKLGGFSFNHPTFTSRARFLLHGPVGYGKSSTINSFNSVFQQRVMERAISAAATDTSETKIYKTYQVKDVQGKILPFIFSDIMGLENAEGGGVLTDDILAAIKGHVRDGYKFKENLPLLDTDDYYNQNPNLSDQVHCLISVIHADKISFMDDSDNTLKKMREIRRAASDLGIPQAVIMTHVDECCPLVHKDLSYIYSSKKIRQAMDHCSKKLGVPLKCIFPVKNYHEETNVDSKTDCLILDALQRIVQLAGDYVEEKLQALPQIP